MRRLSAKLPALLGFCALFALQGVPVSGQGALKPIQIDPNIRQMPRTVHLEIVINGEVTRKFLEFVFEPATGKLSAKRSEYEAAGIRVPGTSAPNEIVPADAIGAAWRY